MSTEMNLFIGKHTYSVQETVLHKNNKK